MQVETKLTLECGKLWEKTFTFKTSQDWSNRVYVCPICGDVWAKWDFGATEWCPYRVPCIGHNWHSLTRSGTLLLQHKTDLYRLPPELLLRELELHTKGKSNVT